MAMHRHLLRDNVPLRLHALSMRWVLMLFVILAAVMGGEARAVVVTGRAVVSERDGRAEMVAKGVEALLVESERASRGADEAVGLVDAGPLALWFPGGSAVARSDCGDRLAVFSGGTSAAEYTVTAAAGSAWTVPSAATVLHVRGPDLGGGTKGLRYSLRNGLPTFNRYNGRGDVVAQSDIDGTTTWAASYQADGRRTSEAGTNIERHRACTKEQDPTGLLNEGFRYRDMETGTFISRDPLGFVDGPNVYCYVRQNPWTHWDPEGLFVGALVKRINEHVIRPAAESFVGAVIDALPQSAVEQLSNSRGFESAMEAGRTVSGGIMHGSQEALGMLSPMDGAADKLLKGDLGGAGNEAMLEAFGGRVFKAAGKGMAAVKRHAGKLDEAVGALSHADDAASATATGVRESIEEASSVLAKEGGGVANSADDLVTGAYETLSKNSSIPGQAHHLNQDAAFKSVMPTNQGVSIKLEGNAFSGIGSPHYNAHSSLEGFWNQFRRGGARSGEVPTNLQYSKALADSLRAAGLNPAQVQQALRASISQRVRAGQLGGLEIPRVPRRINQTK
jgi:RHS repeat-associated protein